MLWIFGAQAGRNTGVGFKHMAGAAEGLVLVWGGGG